MITHRHLAIIGFVAFPVLIAVALTGYLPANPYIVAGPIIPQTYTLTYSQTIFSMVNTTGFATTVTQNPVTTYYITTTGVSSYIVFTTSQPTTQTTTSTIVSATSTISLTSTLTCLACQTTSFALTTTSTPTGSGQSGGGDVGRGRGQGFVFVPITPGANPGYYEMDNGVTGIMMPYYLLLSGIVLMAVSGSYLYKTKP